MPTGPKVFLALPDVTGPTLKTALCHIRALVGRFDKYRGLRGRSQGPLSSTMLGSYVIVVAPTSPPLLVVDSTTFFLRSFLRQGLAFSYRSTIRAALR